MQDTKRIDYPLQRRYPRLFQALSEFSLCIVTFACAISIARYDPNPNGSPPVFLTPEERNKTHEHICNISAREADFPVGPLQVTMSLGLLKRQY